MNAAPHLPAESKLAIHQTIPQDEDQWGTCCRVQSCMGTLTVKVLMSLNSVSA